ncbi:DUF624 domain-containing protein [Virgibacillus pantothenticus]|uniref:DUF624 domain-containing protein n=1 Tax=Virgibacillus pantothenticus TaxID=1473 RepID=UPI001C22A313|nr:DUF624 domain-containing protein [Virgibacillus pantothenticus]MBU8565673.1 DUF624 domain-containing protein [Virgibacillus pantothenticus]MBU8601244.1 DUF624 domain-containing protein [Virgibacillus pantothenticus]MBU8635594.1 DUF624 domain-containing protein [Virgibacillus pantothenticus]MBU8643287.1 DUF624 domain-containing protein [Virgibacillus pantothenticus]MBU8647465.1 DUF624 domain-containing protein [Virgibacillus pantothenticus]
MTYFKDNYKKSFLVDSAWAIIWFIWLIDILYFHKQNEWLMMLFVIGGVCLFVMNVNYFSVFTHYHMKLMGYFKNAFLLQWAVHYYAFLY